MISVMNRRGSVALVVALIIVVALVAAGGIWYWKTYKSNTGRSESSPIVTSFNNSATSTEVAVCDNIFTNPSSSIAISNTELHQIKKVVAAQAVAGDQIFLLVGTYDNNYNYSSLEIEKDTVSDIINDTLNLQTVANIPINSDPTVVAAYFMAADDVVVYDLGYQYNDATAQYANETLVAIDAQTGKQLWTIAGPITGSPAIVEDAVYVPTNYGLIKMDDASEKSLWQFAEARSSALLASDTVFTTNACGWACRNSSTSMLYALNDSNGVLITSAVVPVSNISQWGQCGGNIYFDSEAAPNVSASYRLDPATMEITPLGSGIN